MAWPFSVLVLTLNEERNLPVCLASVRECDDVVVLDSGSSDRTADLARAAGARVFTRRFDNFASQRNYASSAIAFRHPWVFHLDADEQMTAELAAECSAAADRADLDGFFVAPRMLFLGRWIPHCTDYPAWQARFVRAAEFEFVEVGHGQREAPRMRLDWLRSNYLHDLSAGGEAAWLEKHRRYARAEAIAQAEASVEKARLRNLASLLSSDSLRRRRAFKKAAEQVPFRPAARFLYQYVLRGGFLDGGAGLRYCRLLARYEGFIAEEKGRQRQEARRGRSQSRLVFVNRFYWPDEVATGQLLTDLAEALAARGWAVTVVASRPGRDAISGGEWRHGVRIERVGRGRRPRPGLVFKALDFCSFSVRALGRLARLARRGDIIISLTDPPLLGVGIGLIAWARGCPCVHWVQDIYPEIAMAVTNRKELRLFRPLRNAIWRKAGACVTLGREMAAVLAESGVSAGKIHVIPNWPPAGLGPPAADDVAAFLGAWSAAGSFVVAYSGNLGRVHDLEVILSAAEAMRGDARTLFLLVGDGAQRAPLEAEALRRGLTNVRFLPAQPRESLAASLAAGDVHLVSLRPGCERYVFPSKLSGLAAVGRPVLFIGPLDCEPARLVVDHRFGRAFTREDVAGIVRWLRELRTRPEERARLSAAAVQFAREGDGIKISAEKWDRIFTGLLL